MSKDYLHIRVSPETLKQINELKALYGFKTYSKVIDFIVNEHYLSNTAQGKEILKQSIDIIKGFEKSFKDLSNKLK